MPPLTPKEALLGFRKRFGKGERYREYTAADDERLKARLPEVMRAIVKKDGWCSYRDQALWLCDPDDWEPAARAWFPDQTPPDVLARSSFGDLFVVDRNVEVQGSIYEVLFFLVIPQSYWILMDVDDPNWFFGETITAKGFMVNSEAAQRKAARATGGALAWDEMYGFVPPHPLGRRPPISGIKRVKAREHLVLLSQQEPIRRQ